MCGVDVWVGLFDDFIEVVIYDVIWVLFSFLYVFCVEFLRYLDVIYRVLKLVGYFYFGLKFGEGEKCDLIGWFYFYF